MELADTGHDVKKTPRIFHKGETMKRCGLSHSRFFRPRRPRDRHSNIDAQSLGQSVERVEGGTRTNGKTPPRVKLVRSEL
jgi:hypothetical protein